VSDDDEICDPIIGWIAAVRSCDLEAVLARHDPDVVMFDVPPPYRGVRGIDEYRESWGPFFEWLREGAVFELDDLDVVAGADVAFAYALLRCGTPADFDANPDNRLRVTVGLCKRDDGWVVTHEHHSFPMT
jgi:ketosteroid isomerase-like protein